ncbi:otolith matrix protein OMM-64-like [Adelges cooleyi]|uniref:otolith matrix protein OMM-64-like n=1 Tax=Adelges cooleyi TaxID=133065 RepID=UPI00217F7A1F|nr:otolith matrix protein OMM-64-like [Adelges cooleyi]
MIERKERNVHKFYNDDGVVDDQDSDGDNPKDKDQLDTLDKKPVVNKFMLSKSTLSASVKLTCNDKDVLVSQSLSFKSFADDNGDEGLIVIDDSCKSDPKKRTIKKNLSSHSAARSHVLKHDIWKRVRAAREAGLREVQSDDEDEEEYLLKDDNKKSDYEDKAVMDEDEETYDDNEEEEEIDEEELMDDDYSERKKNNKNKKNGFIDFECEVDSAEDVSDSSESDVDDNDEDKIDAVKKNPLDSSDSDSSTGIKTGVWKSLMSPESAGPVEDGRSSKKKRRAVVLSDSDDDEGNLSEPSKLDALPIFDTQMASTQQLFDLCSGKEFCTQQTNSDAASVHGGSSDGFVSDVPGESDIEDSDAEDQPNDGGDSVGKAGIDDVNDGTDNEENGNDDDGELGDTESVDGENAKITDFFDDEAELSEDEEGVWNDEDDEEDEDAANEEDLKMIVNDNGEVDESIRDSLGKIYMRQMLDDDKRQVAELQEMLLEDGDLHSDMGRKRKFQWDDGGDEAGAYKRPLFSSSEGEDDDDDDDNDNGDNGKCKIDSEAAWRKERHVRDSYLATENDDEHDDDEVCQNLTALGTKKTHVIKYQANKTVVANTSVTKVLAEVAVVETTVVQNKDPVKPPDQVEVPTVEICVNKTNGPVAAVKGSFMMRKGSNSRAAAALMLVDSKKKAMGASSGTNDGNTVKQLTTAKATVTNPFAYLIGGTSTSTEIKTTTMTTVSSSSASARPENLISRTRPKKSGGLLKAFLPLE